MTPVKDRPIPTNSLISPHGGALVNRMVPAAEAPSARRSAASLLSVPITERTLADIQMIATGAYSPLIGFLGADDYASVVSSLRLVNGVLWPFPITFGIDRATASNVQEGDAVALSYAGDVAAVLHVESVYQPDKARDAAAIFKSVDRRHPGVAAFLDQGDTFLGGTLDVFGVRLPPAFPQPYLTPRDSRSAFRDRGWTSVVGFQTRNPIHRAHEYITKCALELVDGLFLHPTVGETAEGDLPVSVRMACYEAVVSNYYPRERVLLAANPSNMFFAGPREAVLHAIARQNHGCTHFIVGRDHAGVGRTYGPYEAQELVKRFSREDLLIQPLFFENSFWCKRTGGLATSKTSPSAESERIYLSGSDVRRIVREGGELPPELVRPEVAAILKEAQGRG